MRPSIRLDLNQLVEIEHCLASDRRPGVRQRAAAIRLLHLGSTPTQAAIRLGCTAKSVRLWRQRYLDRGVEGLADRPRSGRPLKGGADYQEVLEAALACEPEDAGLWFTGWSALRLSRYMTQLTGVALSVGRLRLLLKRLGYSYQRYIHSTPNPNPPSMERWRGTGLEHLVTAVFAEKREYRWGWKRPTG